MQAATLSADLPLAILEAIPNPVFVKNAKTRYVWVNRIFESTFGVTRGALIGRLEKEVFPDWPSFQSESSERRVLKSGNLAESHQAITTATGESRKAVTRRSKLITASNEIFVVGIMHDLTDMLTSHARLAAEARDLTMLANTDMLTGCLNRRALFDLARGLEPARLPFGVLLIDLDHFKAINDSHGHAAGDQALINFAARVESVIPKISHFARIGGDEFVVLLPHATPKTLHETGSAICRALADTPLTYRGDEIHVTVTIGAAFDSGHRTLDLDDLIRRADVALYAAKAAGRNRCELAA